LNYHTLPTVGLEGSYHGFRLSDGSIVKVRILDTGGQERFNAINRTYYKLADCCLLVYDITSEKSFEKIENFYIQELKEKASNIIKVILLGNKTDLEDKRVITHEKGVDLAQENGYIFMETSCKDNYNVSDAFTALIEMTNIELIKRGRMPKNRNDTVITVRPEKTHKKAKKNKCC
jgi:small GTP-binding protein